MRVRRRKPIAVVVWLALAAPLATAQTHWDAGGDGLDWLDPDNWDNGVPHLGKDGFIGRGGTAEVGGIEPGQSIDAQNLTIGFSTDDSPPIGSPQGPGTLDIDINTDLTVDLDLFVGHVSGTGGSTTGTLNTHHPGADVRVGDDAYFGFYDAGTSIFGQAIGNAGIDGILSSSGTSSELVVGRTDTDRPAVGDVAVGNGVNDFRNVWVGHVNTLATGSGTGDLNVAGTLSSTRTSPSIFVGTSSGPGDADGGLGVNGNVSGFRNVQVGKSIHDGDGLGVAGIAGDLIGTGTGNLWVGHNLTLGGAARGTLDLIGTPTVSGYTNVFVGYAQDLAATSLTDGSATGTLNGDFTNLGTLTGTGAGDLRIGQSDAAGQATGIVDRFANISGFNNVVVGRATGDGPALVDASGELTMSGALTGTGNGHLRVALSEGSGTAVGAVRVPTSLGGFSNISVGVAQVSGDTDGMLITASDLDQGSDFGGELLVGVSSGTGSSFGMIRGLDDPANPGLPFGTGDVDGFNVVSIGVTESSGDATGTLITSGAFNVDPWTEGEIYLSHMRIGVSNGTGVAHGTLHASEGIDDLDTLTIGLATDDDGTANADATGVLTVGDNGVVPRVLSEFVAQRRALVIGRTVGSGTAHGTAHITGHVLRWSRGFFTVGREHGGVLIGTTDQFSSGDGTGILTVTDGVLSGRDLDWQGELTIGVTHGSGAATGTVNVTGTPNPDLPFFPFTHTGSVHDFDEVNVGVTGEFAGSATALGQLTIEGHLQSPFNEFNTLTIGHVVGSGTADGTVSVGGIVAGYATVDVGTVSPRGGVLSNATGSLTVNGIDDLGRSMAGVNLMTSSLSIGRHSGHTGNDAQATGTLTLAGSIVFYASVAVGLAEASGDAAGTLITPGDIDQGSEFGGNLLVGVSTDTGSAIGTIHGGDNPADATNPFGTQDIDGFNIVSIGVAESSGNATGTLISSGEFTVDPAIETGPFASNMQIGVSLGNGVAHGTMHAELGISELDALSIGFATDDDGTEAVDATGELTINEGGLIPFFIGVGNLGQRRFLYVGRTVGSGTAHGTANITGHVERFSRGVFFSEREHGGVVVGTTGPASTGDATGTLNVTDGVLSGEENGLTGELVIGVTEGSGKAIGTLNVTGTPNNVFGFDQVRVGVADGSGIGEGTLTVSGNLTIDAPSASVASSSLSIGVANQSSGIGEGAAIIDNGVTGFHNVRVGAGIGNSDGVLTIADLGLTLTGDQPSALTVGHHRGSSGLAKGALSTFGIGTGNVAGYDDVWVGLTESSGDADGNALVFGNLTGTGEGDLLVGNSADPDAVLTPTGQARGLVSTLDVSGFDNVVVGLATGNGPADVEATGGIDASGIVGTGAGQLRIGVTPGGDATARGTANVSGTPGVRGFQTVQVGVSVGFDPGHATGELTIEGGPLANTGSGAGVLSIGDSTSPGSATGTVSIIDGAITGYAAIFVGLESGGGSSNGTLNLTNSLMTGTDLFVGSTGTDGNGTINLNPSRVDLDGSLTLGDGGTVALTIEGPTPADGTGAPGQFSHITASTTNLDGTLNINVAHDFTPALGTTFDVLAYNLRGTDSMFDDINGTLLSTSLALAPLFTDTDAIPDGNDDALILRASIPGDLNLDDAVSVADLSTFALHFNTAPGLYDEAADENSWEKGDFNADGAITVADLSLLALNFGFDGTDPVNPVPGAGLSLADAARLMGIDPAAVPEPTSGVLLALVLAPWVVRGRVTHTTA